MMPRGAEIYELFSAFDDAGPDIQLLSLIFATHDAR